MTTTRVSPVSRLVTVTVTPGSTAPWSSTTVPSIVPLMACDCASAGEASHERQETRCEDAKHSTHSGGGIRFRNTFRPPRQTHVRRDDVMTMKLSISLGRGRSVRPPIGPPAPVPTAALGQVMRTDTLDLAASPWRRSLFLRSTRSDIDRPRGWRSAHASDKCAYRFGRTQRWFRRASQRLAGGQMDLPAPCCPK